LQQIAENNVWIVPGSNYAVVPTVNEQGVQSLYGIFFSLDRAKGLPVQLHMRVQSAHLRKEEEIITFGTVRFCHLVSLRMQNKHPQRNTSAHRKKPSIK
jgi:hypothetical protein